MTSPEQMVYETEGRHGGDVRGWHGEQARADADSREAEEYYRRCIDELCGLGDKLGDWVLMIDRKHADSCRAPAFWRETVFRWRWK